jgi:hypothetical protein
MGCTTFTMADFTVGDYFYQEFQLRDMGNESGVSLDADVVITAALFNHAGRKLTDLVVNKISSDALIDPQDNIDPITSVGWFSVSCLNTNDWVTGDCFIEVVFSFSGYTRTLAPIAFTVRN